MILVLISYIFYGMQLKHSNDITDFVRQPKSNMIHHYICSLHKTSQLNCTPKMAEIII